MDNARIRKQDRNLPQHIWGFLHVKPGVNIHGKVNITCTLYVMGIFVYLVHHSGNDNIDTHIHPLHCFVLDFDGISSNILCDNSP